MDLLRGRWQDHVDRIGEVDALLADPPYSARTHKASRTARSSDGCERPAISYAHWDSHDVEEFVEAWAPRTRGWFCAMTSHDLFPVYEEALRREGRYVFAPIPCVIRGMTVRRAGDGPSSWCVWLVVARPRTKAMARWGALPGAYITARAHRSRFQGAKPLTLVRDILRDYSRRGDLVCDPCAGTGTTFVAAALLGRDAIGCEVDPATHDLAMARLDEEGICG